MMDLNPLLLQELVERALLEDIGHGDITTQTLIPIDAQAESKVVFREAGIVAGLPIIRAVFQHVDPTLTVTFLVEEGAQIEPDTAVAVIRGNARGMLTGERVALNFIQRTSGIATLTRRFVDAVKSTKARMLDTRKTTPGLRMLEKYAVQVGGGMNHRFGLYDAFLIKDNHLAVLAHQGLSTADAVKQARQVAGPFMRVEVEVESVAQALEAMQAGADIIMLDNMPPGMLHAVVKAIKGKVLLEASGGVTLENVQAVAASGVDYISTSSLTASARALDVGLDMELTTDDSGLGSR